MKKLTAFALAMVCTFSLMGCTQQNKTETTLGVVEPYISIPEFSYEEVCKTYVDGMWGVKTSGFVNISETEINLDNVVERAKNECTIEWGEVSVYLDTAACIWRVHFSPGGMVVGGDQSVFLDYDGKTVLIVYGE